MKKLGTCDVSDDIDVACTECSTWQCNTILSVHNQLIWSAWPQTRYQHTVCNTHTWM